MSFKSNYQISQTFTIRKLTKPLVSGEKFSDNVLIIKHQ